jgi:hypothetical protein
MPLARHNQTPALVCRGLRFFLSSFHYVGRRKFTERLRGGGRRAPPIEDVVQTTTRNSVPFYKPRKVSSDSLFRQEINARSTT